MNFVRELEETVCFIQMTKNWKDENVEDIQYSFPTCILEQLVMFSGLQ